MRLPYVPQRAARTQVFAAVQPQVGSPGERRVRHIAAMIRIHLSSKLWFANEATQPPLVKVPREVYVHGCVDGQPSKENGRRSWPNDIRMLRRRVPNHGPLGEPRAYEREAEGTEWGYPKVMGSSIEAL